MSSALTISRLFLLAAILSATLHAADKYLDRKSVV